MQLSPYFKMLARQKRICPECQRRSLRIEPSLHPDVAYEECDCGYSYTLEAPAGYQVGEPAQDKGRIIRVDFKRKAK